MRKALPDIPEDQYPATALDREAGDRFGRLAGFGGARLADLEPLEQVAEHRARPRIAYFRPFGRGAR